MDGLRWHRIESGYRSGGGLINQVFRSKELLALCIGVQGVMICRYEGMLLQSFSHQRKRDEVGGARLKAIW